MSTEINKEDSPFKKRYVYKLIANFSILGIGIVRQSIIPRALGPSSYGDFSFITNFFLQIVNLLNFSSSTAFFTKLSQRQDDRKLISFYFYFTLLLGVTLVLLLVICFVSGINSFIWPGQERLFVLMAAVWAFLKYYNGVLIQTSDAFALTVRSEIVNIIQKAFGLMIILILFWRKWFTFVNFFSQQLIIFFLAVVLLVWVIQKGGKPLLSHWRLKKSDILLYAKEFAAFCFPLIILTIFTEFEGIFSRWFLQKFAGSIEQGYYGLAYQVGFISVLFTSAMIPLIAREYAISAGNKDIKQLSRLFSRFVPMLYAITAYFSVFFAVEANKVILLFGGKAYAEAILPLTIMCFYPIHQTYGQMNASVFFATGNTVIYRNIGILLTVTSLPLTFFLIGPEKYGGFQFGATGLAIKMVFIQFLSVNIQLWYNLKILKLPFRRFASHQVIIILLFTAVAFLSSKIINTILPDLHFFITFLISGFVYTICIITLGIIFPWIFALKKEEIIKLLGYLRGTKI